jgi:phosphoribosyl 1,2-cyclic phosphodiesterase
LNVTFYGVRGSTPVAGSEFARVGGHTSCVAITTDDASLPTLILDAGTGLQSLAPRFASAPFDGAILLTHLHWDHVQGLPFFPPIDRDDARTLLAQPAQGEPVEVLSRAMSPPHFPIRPDELAGQWTHVALEAGKHDFGAFDVVAHDVVHKGGRTFGYRVMHEGRVFAYVPDALDDNDDAICELAADADVFVRGTPFVVAEAARAAAYGHGTAEHAAEIARRADARQLVITHHGPTRVDDAVDEIAARVGAIAAYEGLTLTI